MLSLRGCGCVACCFEAIVAAQITPLVPSSYLRPDSFFFSSGCLLTSPFARFLQVPVWSAVPDTFHHALHAPRIPSASSCSPRAINSIYLFIMSPSANQSSSRPGQPSTPTRTRMSSLFNTIRTSIYGERMLFVGCSRG